MALHTWVAGEEITAADLNDSFTTKVAITGNETIAGVKTFSSAPKSQVAAAATQELVRYDEAVFDTGNQTIAGVKTFSSIPVLPAADPTTDNQATRKSYVDGLRRLKYVEIVPLSAFGLGKAWANWDLSSSIPVNALYADITATAFHSSQVSIGVRKNGSALNRVCTIAVANYPSSFHFTTELDAGRIVELWSDAAGVAQWDCVGYWIQV